MNQLLYIIDFQTMPTGVWTCFNRRRGVVGVIWRPGGASGKRCEEVFPSLTGFLGYLVDFLAVSQGLGCGWRHLGSAGKAFWRHLGPST